ncbi:hypothetical protein [Agromyces bracchium]|uniref:VCBS repeat-containing protein n=1 Tax=Agromyces bracchium TaxID=88376 RepID=A0A6I3MCW3_9MICO|nr:hypothetical protein [Agromyces bracchium]MTH69226.1 hypothetical protein [Agromyces bracchium]
MKHRRIVAMLAAVGAVAAALTVGATPAVAATAPGSWYYLTNGTTGGEADITFAYGKPDDVVLVGDWNGDATDTLGVRRGNQYYLTNGTTGGTADITFAYGRSTDVVLVGDWDGDGTDTLGVRRGNQYYLTNGTTGGAADITFAYGKADDVVLVGDWDGDGKDTLGVRRASNYYLTNGTTGGQADITFAYGKAADVVLVGDWNGDATDTLGVRRGSSYYLTNGTTGGAADITFAYGKADDVVLIGDWNGDGTSTLGVRRATSPTLKIPAVPAGELGWAFAVPGEVQPALYKSTNATKDCVWWTEDAAENEIGYGFGYGTGRSAYAQIGSDASWFLEKAECGTWTEARSSDPKKLATTFGDGQYRVGIDIRSGIYGTTVPANAEYCYIASLKDFRGVDATSILGNYWGTPGETIYWDVYSTDKGFETDGCGTWTKVAESGAWGSAGAFAPSADGSFAPSSDEVGAFDLRGSTPLQPRPTAELPAID